MKGSFSIGTLFGGFAGAIAMFALPAAAQTFPDLVGTWTGTSEAVMIGDSSHYDPDAKNPGKPRTASADFTLELAGQDGRRLWGTISTGNASEPWPGVIHSNGGSFGAIDADGYLDGFILSKDELELCYLQTGSSMIASCVMFTRE